MKILVSLSDVDYLVPETERAAYVSDECHRHILRSVGGVFVLFPGMRKYLQGVRYTKKLTSSFDAFDKELTYSTYGLSGTVQEAQELLARANKPGFSVHQARGFDSLIIHELGHAVDHWIRWKHRHDEDALDAYWQDKHELFKTLPHPSQYALKNASEFMAEQFALEYLGHGKRALIELLFKWRDK
jgi:hypothetical protein